jgi:hypothetical protein
MKSPFACINTYQYREEGRYDPSVGRIVIHPGFMRRKFSCFSAPPLPCGL